MVKRSTAPAPFAHTSDDGCGAIGHFVAALAEWLSVSLYILPKNESADILVKRSGVDWYIISFDECRTFDMHSTSTRQAYVCSRLAKVNWWLHLLNLTLVRYVKTDTFPEELVKPFLKLKIGRHRVIRRVGDDGVMESPC